MASIFERDGKFYRSFKEHGHWVKRLLGETREIAERRLAELHHRVPPPPPPNLLRFPLAVNAYLKNIEVYAKPRSVVMARIPCRLLLDHFSEHGLDPRGVEQFIAWRRKKASTKTVNNDLVILRAILHHAVEIGLLAAMPFKIKLLKTSKKRVLRVLSPGDIEGLWIGAHKGAKYPGLEGSNSAVQKGVGFRQWTDCR